MSEPIIEYRYEFNAMDFVSKYAERISRVIDEETLANVEHQLAMYGYVKVVRCQDCKYWRRFYPESKQRFGTCRAWRYTMRYDGYCHNAILFLLCRTEQPRASENKQLGLRVPPPRPREHASPGPYSGRPPAHHEEDPRQCHRHSDRSLDPGHFLLLMAGQPSPRSILRRPGRKEGGREARPAPRGPHHPAHCEYALRSGWAAGEPRRAS